jgi:hypothetical protein
MNSYDDFDSAPGAPQGYLSGIDEETVTSFTALKLQRKQRLESLIEKRKNNFLYLMEIHLGGNFWLNSVLFDKKELNAYAMSEKTSTRSVMFYYFGISLSKILELPSGSTTIKAMLQFLEEWEYYFASNTMQSMKYVMARNSNFIYPNFMPTDSIPQTSGSGGNSSGGNGVGSHGTGNGHNYNSNSSSVDLQDHQIKSGIYKFNNDIVYEHLLTPHIPFELNYIEVLHSLCQMLYSLYDKFWHEDSFRCVPSLPPILTLPPPPFLAASSHITTPL